MSYRFARHAAVVVVVLLTLAVRGDESKTISVKVRVVKTDTTNKRVCLAEDDGSQTWYEINPEKNKRLEIGGKPSFVFNVKADMTGVLLLPRDPKDPGFTLSLNPLAAKTAPALPPGANATLIDKNGKMHPIWVPNGTPSATYGLRAYVLPATPYWGAQSQGVSSYGYGSQSQPPAPFGAPSFGANSFARSPNYSGFGNGVGYVARPWTEDRALDNIFAALLAHVGKLVAERSDDLFVQVFGGAFATAIRDNQIEAALSGYLPQLPQGAVRFVRRLITSALDGETSAVWFCATMTKEELVEHLKKDYPGLEASVQLVELLVKVAQRAR